MRTQIIAEIGVNHNGNLDMALDLVKAAHQAGADFVKTQTFCADLVVKTQASKAEYQLSSVHDQETSHQMLRRLELSLADQIKIRNYCNSLGIAYLSSPFDMPSLRILCHTLELPLLKLGSGEITNIPMIHEIGRLKRRLLFSSGASTMSDIRHALNVYAAGYVYPQADILQLTDEHLTQAVAMVKSTGVVTVFHCVSQYPAPAHSLSLKAIPFMRAELGIDVGFSDHSMGDTAALGAVALGASWLEKHITLDRELPGPDHQASMLPSEFASLVQKIREMEQALGQPAKSVQACEQNNLMAIRRSIYAARDIAQGEKIEDSAVLLLRPVAPGAVSAADYFKVIGKTSPQAILAGSPIPKEVIGD